MSAFSKSLPENEFTHQSLLDYFASPASMVDRVSTSIDELTRAVQNPHIDVGSTQFSAFMSSFKDFLPSNEMAEKAFYVIICLILHHYANVDKYAILSKALLAALAAHLMYRFPEDKHLHKIILVVGAVLVADYALHLGVRKSGASSYTEDNLDDGSRPREWIAQTGACIDATALLALLGYFFKSMTSEEFDKYNITKFMKLLGDIPRIKSGLAVFIEFFLESLQKLIDFVCSTAGVTPYKLQASLYPELDAICARFNDFILSLRLGRSYNYESAMELFELEKEAIKMVASIPDTNAFVQYKKQGLTLLSNIKPIVGRMERSNIYNNGPRREPTAIMLGGPTGVGKSTSVLPLMLAVNAKVMPQERLQGFKKNHNDEIWNYIPENNFFDSYHNQFNMIVDEAGAQHDSIGSPDAGALAILRAVNIMPYPLHMANLEDKGNTNFRSELVWATTNRTFFDWKSMYLSEAYCRRFSLSYLVVPKKEHCVEGTYTDDPWDRRLDVSKIPDSEDGFSLEIAEFIPYSFDRATCGIKGAPQSFVQLVDIIVNQYEYNKSKQDKLLAFHQTIKNRYLAKRMVDEHISFDDHEDFNKEMNRFYEDAPFAKEVIVTCRDSLKMLYENNMKTYRDYEAVCVKAIIAGTEQAMEQWKALSLPSLALDKSLMAGCALSIGGILLMWKLIAPKVLGAQSGDVKRTVVKVRPLKSKSHADMQSMYQSAMKQQSDINQNCLAKAQKIIDYNLFSVDVDLEVGVERLGFALFTHGRYCVMPEHFIHVIESLIEDNRCNINPTITFQRVGSSKQCFKVGWDDIGVCHLEEDGQTDTSYVLLPEVIPQQKDIRSFICSSKESRTDNRFAAALLRPITKGGYSLVTTNVIPVGAQEYNGFRIQKGFKYNIATKPGDCGAPLFIIGAGVDPVVVGLHVAGNMQQGLATKVIKESINTVFKDLKYIKDELEFQPQSSHIMSDNFLTTHEVQPIPLPNKTCMVPSPLHTIWGGTSYKPAHLKAFKNEEGLEVDPWQLCRSKYAGVSQRFNLFLLDCVADNVVSEMLFTSVADDPWPHRVYTFEEAVSGVDGIPYCDGLPRNTSSGYPFCLDNVLPGKADWFGSQGPYEFVSSKCIELRQSVIFTIKSLSVGVRHDCIYADFLKDKCLEATKVDKGKGRLISAAPLDSVIIFRMYFGDLIRWICSNRISNGSAVACNPYSIEWKMILDHLTSIGDKAIFGDYSAYDGTLCPVIMYQFLKLSKAFYHNATNEDNIIRDTLFQEIVNSRHLANVSGGKALVYEWFGGNPSGNFLTTHLNTFCNQVIVRYSVADCRLRHMGTNHLSATESEVYQSVRDMSSNVRMIAFGDDNGFVVSDAFAIFCDQTKITESMASIGFKYTDEDKGDVQHTHRHPSECSFLKRGFVKRHGKWYAPLDMTSILEMVKWTKKSATKDSFISVVNTCLEELAIHGNETYSRYAPELVSGSVEHMSYLPPTSYKHHQQVSMHESSYY